MVTLAGRTVLSLDGPWRFVLDLHDEGLRQRWYAHDDTPVAAWAIPRDYDDGAWQTAPVPSCWNMLQPEWMYFEGSAWYTRVFDRPHGPPGERVFLRVGAANYEARVFLNGDFVGAHRGGSTPFFIELTGRLKDGANRLQIQVDNRRRLDQVPMNHTDWFNYGGLYREVGLVRVPAVFIRDFGVALAPGSGGTASPSTSRSPRPATSTPMWKSKVSRHIACASSAASAASSSRPRRTCGARAVRGSMRCA